MLVYDSSSSLTLVVYACLGTISPSLRSSSDTSQELSLRCLPTGTASISYICTILTTQVLPACSYWGIRLHPETKFQSMTQLSQQHHAPILTSQLHPKVPAQIYSLNRSQTRPAHESLSLKHQLQTAPLD